MSSGTPDQFGWNVGKPDGQSTAHPVSSAIILSPFATRDNSPKLSGSHIPLEGKFTLSSSVVPITERNSHPINVFRQCTKQFGALRTPVVHTIAARAVNGLESSFVSVRRVDGKYGMQNLARIIMEKPEQVLPKNGIDMNDVNNIPLIEVESGSSEASNLLSVPAGDYPADLFSIRDEPGDVRLFNVAPVDVSFLIDEEKTGCHQCRTRTYAKMRCANISVMDQGLCTARYCHRCIYIRFVRAFRL